MLWGATPGGRPVAIYDGCPGMNLSAVPRTEAARPLLYPQMVYDGPVLATRFRFVVNFTAQLDHLARPHQIVKLGQGDDFTGPWHEFDHTII